jgi:hypothetical protein
VELRDNCVSRLLSPKFEEAGGYVMLTAAKAFNAKKLALWLEKVKPHLGLVFDLFCRLDQSGMVKALEAIGDYNK